MVHIRCAIVAHENQENKSLEAHYKFDRKRVILKRTHNEDDHWAPATIPRRVPVGRLLPDTIDAPGLTLQRRQQMQQ